eukprot:TRINITY_DN19299_c0_g1_i1.p1 TRINITY_DN19299_c0_g1~~TRINITY_DN19299_c0_g1_i1.p1  ORF type:complete len:163 (+),score=19.26 TRINITY_DN19299_c0_g1_i1:180-668(+)
MADPHQGEVQMLKLNKPPPAQVMYHRPTPALNQQIQWCASAIRRIARSAGMASVGGVVGFGGYVVLHQSMWRSAESQVTLCDQWCARMGQPIHRVTLVTENSSKQQVSEWAVDQWNSAVDWSWGVLTGVANTSAEEMQSSIHASSDTVRKGMQAGWERLIGK